MPVGAGAGLLPAGVGAGAGVGVEGVSAGGVPRPKSCFKLSLNGIVQLFQRVLYLEQQLSAAGKSVGRQAVGFHYKRSSLV